VREPWISRPPGWAVKEIRSVGPFVTGAVFEPHGGSPVEWSSRRHRKGLGLEARWRARRAFWAHLNWWIGALFMIGSACFALGSAPFYAELLEPAVVGVTYFVGSLFFTSAALLQFLQAVNAERAVGGEAHGERRFRILSLEPHRIDWCATAVQLVGTLFFNVTTFTALNDALSTRQEDIRVWAPDAFGSVCFLVASALALLEVCNAWSCLRWRDISWRIAALNMLGSIFFGISAVTSFVLPDTGELLNTAATNAFTFLGAVCFLAGAYLLFPEDRSARAS
jgi:hypothetical protein